MTTGMLDEALEGNWGTQKKKPWQGGGDNGATSDMPITKNGYDKSEVISALQKTIRRGQEAEALYWASELIDSGETYRMWRRLIVIAAEDVGLADPEMTARIMTMKLAHDFGRESNIVFQAIMMLCRSAKNREADDASYLYDLRRKQNWKIPMPPEAVDGHTRRGRTDLYHMARQTGEDWTTLWNREFYYDVALLQGYVEIETSGTKERYRKALMEFLNMKYETYDINTNRQPRLRSSRSAPKVDALGAGMTVTGGVEIREVGDSDGVVTEGVLEVQSYTDPAIWYRVRIEKAPGGTIPLDCSCPAFQNNPDRICKHQLAVRRTEGKPTK